MARKTAAVATVGADRVLKALEEFESTRDNPTTTNEIAGEFNISDADAFAILNELADAGKIDAGDGNKIPRGSWFILTEDEKPSESVPEAPAKPKRTRRTKAEMEAARAAEAEKTAYAARVAESQDAVTSQGEPFYSAEAAADLDTMAKGEPVIPAVEPVQGADGKNVTVLVSEGSMERRELDAAKGERVISEDVVKGGKFIPVAPAAAWWKVPEFPPTIPEFKGPDNIPAPPQGVSPNFWYMAFYANTATARAFWSAKVDAQLKVWDAEQKDAPPF